jgi:hypothetical protein
MVVALLLAVVAVPAVLAAATQGAPQAPAPVTPGRFPDPPAADRATVWAAGDGAKYSDATRAVARLIERGRPTRFLYLGDVYELGSAADFVANYDTVYSAGTHGDQPDLQPFWNALIGRAVLVLNGHDHDMQRLHPHRGITQLVSGAGGRGHYGVDAGDRRLAFSDDETDGALRLVLRPGIARYAFVSVSGRVLDSGVVRCRTAEADPPR